MSRAFRFGTVRIGPCFREKGFFPALFDHISKGAPMMKRRDFLRTAVLTTLAATAPVGRRAWSQDKPPNIVFIFSDDHAAHAISAYGSRINKTPNIDRIAKGCSETASLRIRSARPAGR